MNETQFEWMGDVELLLAASREGSATQAAQQLGISTATAIRRLVAMEEALGVRFFDRTPAGLIPTPALALALPWAEQMEAAGHGLVRELEGLETQPAGSVRVSLLESISSWVVAPRLPGLLLRYPELEVSLVPEARLMDLDKREADIAIRMVRPTAGDLVSRQLATFELVVAAAPALLEDRKPTSLDQLPWIDWDRSAARTPDVLWLEQNVSNARVVLRSTSVVTMLHAAQAGVGAVVVAAPLAAEMGLTKICVGTKPLLTLTLHLVTHQALRPIPRIVAVWDFIVASFDEALAQATQGNIEYSLGQGTHQ